MTAFSITTQVAPISIMPSSALRMAPWLITVCGPIRTLPTSTAVGATDALGSICGCLPWCLNCMLLPPSDRFRRCFRIGEARPAQDDHGDAGDRRGAAEKDAPGERLMEEQGCRQHADDRHQQRERHG